ncbi:hypothetical protein FRC04_005823 [Tulasnella sp. 424]|nr:hypothetical protein FRC04_005823 [Tulasnella sp. 424]
MEFAEDQPVTGIMDVETRSGKRLASLHREIEASAAAFVTSQGTTATKMLQQTRGPNIAPQSDHDQGRPLLPRSQRQEGLKLVLQSHRNPHENMISDALVKRLVRLAGAHLVFKGGSIVPPGPPANVTMPTQNNFFVEWDEELGSLFNLTAREIYVAYVFEAYSTLVKPEDQQDVQSAVLEYLRWLRTRYRAQFNGEELKARASRQALVSRRRERWKNCIDVILDPRFPELRGHLRLYQTLGIEGIEEEQLVPGPSFGLPHFVAFRSYFLSPEVSSLTSHLLDLHNQFVKPANYVRTVSPITRVVHHIIPRLHYNVYDGNWLRGLSPAIREALAPQHISYNFVHYTT